MRPLCSGQKGLEGDVGTSLNSELTLINVHHTIIISRDLVLYLVTWKG